VHGRGLSSLSAYLVVFVTAKCWPRNVDVFTACVKKTFYFCFMITLAIFHSVL